LVLSRYALRRLNLSQLARGTRGSVGLQSRGRAKSLYGLSRCHRPFHAGELLRRGKRRGDLWPRCKRARREATRGNRTSRHRTLISPLANAPRIGFSPKLAINRSLQNLRECVLARKLPSGYTKAAFKRQISLFFVCKWLLLSPRGGIGRRAKFRFLLWLFSGGSLAFQEIRQNH
jgi:hypothetical protein